MLMQLFAKLARGSNPSTTVRLPNTMRACMCDAPHRDRDRDVLL